MLSRYMELTNFPLSLSQPASSFGDDGSAKPQTGPGLLRLRLPTQEKSSRRFTRERAPPTSTASIGSSFGIRPSLSSTSTFTTSVALVMT
ncbi:hypothetical protein WAI453_012368 [Rhynchosporium graminicola]